MKISDNFMLQEFVPKPVYANTGNYSVRLLDSRIISLAQQIRTYFNRPMTINNWHSNGHRQFSGFRPASYPIQKSGRHSQHRFGRAIDFYIDGLTAEEIREVLIDKRNNHFPFLMAIEKDVTWVHADVRYRPDGSLLLFDPPKKEIVS